MTCLKNSENSTCIDLMLTNVLCSFCSTCALETGLSDFNLMTLIYMILDIGFEILYKHATFKKKHVRSNQMSFFKKELSKAKMTRFGLRNNFLNNQSRRLYTRLRNYMSHL